MLNYSEVYFDKKFNLNEIKFSGTLITFSGLDGSGKTTISKYVEKQLIKKGYEVIYYHHSFIHDNIPFYKALKCAYSSDCISNSNQEYVSFIIAFEYFNFFINQVLQDLGKGKIVILDRYVYDIYVSQTTVFRNDFIHGWKLLESLARKGLHFYLNILPDIAFDRIAKREHGNHKYHESIDNLKIKYDKYKSVVKDYELIQIDSLKSEDEILADVFARI